MDQASGTMENRQGHLHAFAFTLIELLVVIGVLGILLGILLPALARARTSSRELVCRMRLRELGGIVTAYSADYQGLVPYGVPDSTEVRGDPSKWGAYAFQTYRLFAQPYFHEYAGLTPWQEVLYCPGDPRDVEEFSTEFCDTSYAPTSAFYISQDYLDPGLPSEVWSNKLGAKLQRIGNTTFPSDKVGGFEKFIWHRWRGGVGPGIDVSDVHYQKGVWPGSVWFVDGHTGSLDVDDAVQPVDRYPIWGGYPYSLTPWGIAGRDIH